jgi:hypothetical protein
LLILARSDVLLIVGHCVISTLTPSCGMFGSLIPQYIAYVNISSHFPALFTIRR